MVGFNDVVGCPVNVKTCELLIKFVKVSLGTKENSSKPFRGNRP
jgi:hypothetical protein